MKWIKSIFQGAKSPSPRRNESSQTDAIFEKLHRFLNDERAQNDRLPESYRAGIQGGLDCDEVSGARGEFGRSFQNPIPVNGPIGEILYLSNLRTNDRTPIMFHRIGSKNGADAFETVSLDGKVWDILFLHLYHPRKSRRAPTGYGIAQERQDLFLGTSEFVDGFPRHIQDAARDAFQQWVGIPMRTPELRRALEQVVFRRPKQHQDRLTATLSMLDVKEM
jgi:hypothetical protein